MMNGVSFRNMQSANFRINTYEKVHQVGLFIQLITMYGLYNIKLTEASVMHGADLFKAICMQHCVEKRTCVSREQKFTYTSVLSNFITPYFATQKCSCESN